MQHAQAQQQQSLVQLAGQVAGQLARACRKLLHHACQHKQQQQQQPAQRSRMCRSQGPLQAQALVTETACSAAVVRVAAASATE